MINFALQDSPAAHIAHMFSGFPSKADVPAVAISMLRSASVS
jgi:hypothetical protein